MDDHSLHLQGCMYQYSRAIYRSIKDLIDPYVDQELQIEYRRAVLCACEQTMERLAKDPLYFANPARALFQDIRRYFPITAQAEVAWAVNEGVGAAGGTSPASFPQARHGRLAERDVARHRQAHPPALARRVPHGRATVADGA